MGTVIGLSLLPVLAFLFPSLAEKLSDSSEAILGVIGGASSPLSTTGAKSISENDAEFYKQFMAETVIDSTSSMPYISSHEVSRPQSKKHKAIFPNTVKDSDDSKEPKKPLAGLLLGGGSAVSYFSDEIKDFADKKAFPWLVLGAVVLGGIVVYKVVKK